MTIALALGKHSMDASFIDKVQAGASGICVYGLAPPKASTSAVRQQEIAHRQVERLNELQIDGLVVYDLQDEGTRIAAPRPFPFLPTVDPLQYATDSLQSLQVPKVVYRCVGADQPSGLVDWLKGMAAASQPRATVLVGTPAGDAPASLSLPEAQRLARTHAPNLLVGGIAIAERHTRRVDEHTRMLEKMGRGCRFFVTQAVYDVTATKSLLSDYQLAVNDSPFEPAPIILTFSPCGSPKTLAFMKWLGISVPRWLDNELRLAPDPLGTSMRLCERIFDEVWDFAQAKRIPVGINVESVSIRREEIEASVALFRALQSRMQRG